MREKKEKFHRPAGFMMPTGFHIESDSAEQLTVEGCTGLILYEQERIKLGIGKRSLLVTGDGLVIGSMFGSTLMIYGNIATIEYL